MKWNEQQKNYYLLVNEYGNDRKAGCVCLCSIQ